MVLWPQGSVWAGRPRPATGERVRSSNHDEHQRSSTLGKAKTFAAGLALVAFAFTGLTGDGRVFCIGPGGHLSIELSVAGRCSDRVVPAYGRELPLARTLALDGMASSTRCCWGPCLDLAAVQSAELLRSSDSLQPFPSVSPLFLAEAALSAANAAPPRLLGKMGSQCPASSRSLISTTVIRC